MTTIRLAVALGAPVATVWTDLADLGSHVEWMSDAESIRFRTEHRDGVGAAFDCVTKVGPIRLTDRMIVTRWEPPHVMTVAHEGLVTGAGTFRLETLTAGRSRLCWEEELHFPWWLGGPLGEIVGRPVLAKIWQGNLRRFQARFPHP